jgi:hypothetical protein
MTEDSKGPSCAKERARCARTELKLLDWKGESFNAGRIEGSWLPKKKS